MQFTQRRHAARSGATGSETSFVTACFVLDDPLARQILAVLPPVIRMTPEVEQGVPSFVENIQFITREVETDRPGSEIVLLRMADVIFIQILRAYLARVPDDGGGFLGARRDPSTAAAQRGPFKPPTAVTASTQVQRPTPPALPAAA